MESPLSPGVTHTLDNLITVHGLADVVDTLESICFAKCAHYLNDPADKDRRLAHVWECRAARIRRTGLGNEAVASRATARH